MFSLMVFAAAFTFCISAEPHKGMADLPPLLEFSDGSPVKSLRDWQLRRKEIKDLLTCYYYG